MGLGFIEPKKLKSENLIAVPYFIGQPSLDFAGYATVEGLEEDLKQAELESLRDELELLMQGGNDDLRIELGLSLELLGKTTAAQEQLTQAEQQLPENALAPYALARLLMETTELDTEEEPTEGRWSVIVSYLRDAIKYDTDNIPAHYYLGNAIRKLVEEESFVDAVDVYAKYLKAGAPLGQTEEVQAFINAQDPEKQLQAALASGHAALEARNYKRSIEAFAKAVELGSNEARYHLGLAYERSTAYGKAIDTYREALSTGDDSLELQQALGRAVVSLLSNFEPIAEDLSRLGANIQKTADEQERLLQQKIHAHGDKVLGAIEALLPHRGLITDMTFSPAGKNLITAGADAYVKVWDLEMEMPRFGLHVGQPAQQIAFSPDGKLLGVVVGNKPGVLGASTLKVYDAESHVMLYELPSPHSIVFCFLEEKIVYTYAALAQPITNSKAVLAEWDYKTNETNTLSEAPFVPGTHSILVFPDTKDGQFVVLPNLKGKHGPFTLQHFTQNDVIDPADLALQNGDQVIGFSADLGLAAILGEDDSLTLRDWKNRTNLPTPDEVPADLLLVQFLPDATLAVTETGDALIMDRAGKVQTQFNVEEHEVARLSCTANGEMAALCLSDNSVQLYELPKGQQLGRLPFPGLPAWTPAQAIASELKAGSYAQKLARWFNEFKTLRNA